MATFVRVVEEQSFAAAGRRLGLPRAVISKHVQKLEEAFGARLLHRTTRRLSLTDAGVRFHEHCLSILAAVEAAEREIDERQGKPRGLLRMTAPAAFTDLYLTEHLDHFARLYPDVSLDLDCSERFVDLVREGFDVGVRIGALPPSGLVARRLAPSSVVICGAPAYVRRRGTPKTPQDLRRHDCLGYIYQANGGTWDLGGSGGPATVDVTPRHRTNDNRFLRELVVRGHGLAQLPIYLIAADVEAGRLVTVLDRYRDSSRSVYVVHPHRQQVAPKVRALVDHLVRAFAAGATWE
ncbi:LysR family transcriptional regulator [Sorangium sp. So ce269]